MSPKNKFFEKTFEGGNFVFFSSQTAVEVFNCNSSISCNFMDVNWCQAIIYNSFFVKFYINFPKFSLKATSCSTFLGKKSFISNFFQLGSRIRCILVSKRLSIKFINKFFIQTLHPVKTYSNSRIRWIHVWHCWNIRIITIKKPLNLSHDSLFASWKKRRFLEILVDQSSIRFLIEPSMNEKKFSSFSCIHLQILLLNISDLFLCYQKSIS